MDLIWQGLVKAVHLLLSLDAEVFEIAFLSLKVSGSAVLLSLLVGIPGGMFLALARFPGRNFLVSLVNTGMGLPPVVVGLVVSLFLWRSGPFGFFNLMYTPAAMVIAQIIIASPIVTGLVLAAMQQLDPRLRLQALSLGATRWQALWILLREARLPTLAAIMAGFGGVISEIGAVMMVGGNIKGQTRVLTTATVLEARRGNFDLAIALSIILLALSFGVNYLLTMIQQRKGGVPWDSRPFRWK